ncbi:DUF3999 family protein [Halomonas sp. SSL-5]|uniref:DUF3999 family protein n=1 Tax=Halomonas sp. SSL-5 TaxID=3065855 RepID=UPI0027382203|nr:DUF3999 family protein [Halomonas sp. SSL-5]MDY7117296.1 DUF3999 family protein [Halomonas sp. SSL-5]
MRRLGVWTLLLWPTLAPAAEFETAELEESWRHAWPVIVEEPAAAYGLVLTPEVYRSLHTPTLADLQVVDARGQAVPTLVRPAPAPAAAEGFRRVPWFPLSAPPPSDATHWELIGETDAQGRLRRIESRGGGAEARGAGAALVDLGAVDGPVSALTLSWGAITPVDSLYRVEGSDDLETWRTLLARGRLLDITHDGAHLVRRRLELGNTAVRYLRLRPLPGQSAVVLAGIQAVTRQSGPVAKPSWESLEGVRAEGGEFHYRLAARLPVSLADVTSDTPYAARWRLESREEGDAEWRARTPAWTGYRLVDETGELRSPPQALLATRRDRHWRLLTDASRAGPPPTLRLGYTPERVVFLAEGVGPWRLVAGSARVVRQQGAVAPMLDSLRRRQGQGWEPASARLGERETLAGEAALTPPRDWTLWLLWGVLVAGTLLVGGLALRLLRRGDEA